MSYRKCQQSLSSSFCKNSELVYCNDVEGLLQGLVCTHNHEEWGLLNSSKSSLKVVLLHNGNIHPSIPNAHSVHMKETYENMALLLKAVSYSKYEWKICGGLKILRLCLRMQSGYTVCCLLCVCVCVCVCVKGTAEQNTNITKLRIGPCEKTQFQGKSVSEINRLLKKIIFCHRHYINLLKPSGFFPYHKV